MQFNDYLWARTFNRLWEGGVPFFFIQLLEMQYSGYTGIEVHRIFKDAEIEIYHDAIRWYESIPENCDLSYGFYPSKHYASEIGDMDVDAPACVVKSNRIYPNPLVKFWVYNPINC